MAANYDPLMTAIGKQKNSLEVWLTCVPSTIPHFSVGQEAAIGSPSSLLAKRQGLLFLLAGVHWPNNRLPLEISLENRLMLYSYFG